MYGMNFGYSSTSHGSFKETSQALRLEEISNALPKDLCDKVSKVALGVGCILDSDNNFNGSAILISDRHILVPRHCFLKEEGNVSFKTCRVFATTVIDGELDPLPSFKGDYKILEILEGPHRSSPVEISVDVATGFSVQINYKADSNIYVRKYESTTFGSFASRSDLASMKTSPGDSGGARLSAASGAVHSMHQGESEGLKMNDICHSLTNIRDRHADDTIREIANSVLKGMNVIDMEMLAMNFSSIALQSHHVRPEGPPLRIPKYVYRWTDNEGEKEAKKRGIAIDPDQPAGSIPTLITGSPGAATRSGALDNYKILLRIDTTLIPDLTYDGPSSSKGGHWQYNITSDIPKAAIQSLGRQRR